MKFLSKLGQIALKFTEAIPIIGQFAPFIAALIPGKKDDVVIEKGVYTLEQIAQIIMQVEIIGQAVGLPGTQKLQAAAPAVAQAILQSSILVNHKIHDEVLFKQGCTKVADGMADVLNSLKDDIETDNKT